MQTIQRFQLQDLDQVVRLEESVFTHPWRRDAILKMSKDQNVCILVAKRDGEVIGNCSLRAILGEGEITNVSVKEEVRKQGIAREMLNRLFEEGKKMEIQEYTLEVRAKNVAAINLYQSFAFRKEGIRKNFYRDPKDDAWIMWKRNQRLKD